MDKRDVIYIAGSGGMVGKALVRKFGDAGYRNILESSSQDLDLRDAAATQRFFEIYKPKHVILSAALVGGIGANMTRPADFLLDNLLIQNNVIEMSHYSGVEKFLFIGSSCMYPGGYLRTLSEDDLLTAPLEPTNEAYAIAKIAGVKLVSYFRQQYNWNAASIVPCNLYGPNDHFNTTTSHVIPSMIVKFIDAVAHGSDSVTLWGDGTPLREFMYVDDFAEACLMVMENNFSYDLINAGSRDEYSISELAEHIAQATGFEGRIVWDTSKPNGAMRKKLDTSRMDSLGWKASTPLDEGLVRAVKWYKENNG